MTIECSTDLTIQVIAHRGGANLAPENTLAAFQNAIDLGVDMIEIDVEQTRDSIVVVIHDDKVDRTTDGTGWVDSLSYGYVKTLDAGSWFDKSFKNERVPILEEVLQLIDGRVTLLVEIKDGSERYPGIEQRTVEAIQQFNAHSWTIVQSFNKKAIERVKAIDPDIKTYYLLGRNFSEYYKTFRNKDKQSHSFTSGYDGIAVHYKMLNANSVESIKQSGLGLFTWTVDDTSDMAHMINIGVDGIITDSPDKLINLIQ